jgi:hypothetical protein
LSYEAFANRASGQIRSRWGSKKKSSDSLDKEESPKREQPNPAGSEKVSEKLVANLAPEPAPTAPRISIPSSPSSSTQRETPSLTRSKTPVSVEKVEEKKPVLEEKSTPFEDEDVQAHWKSFKEERIANGTSDTEKLVLDRRLEKTGEFELTIFLESQLEISILEKCEQDLLQYLRKHLNNTMIKVLKAVTEQKSTKNLYTSREKFDYMTEQNPHLQSLKDRLGLDFD